MAVYVLGQCRVWLVDLLTEQLLYCFRIEMSRWMLLTLRWKDTQTDSSGRSTHREWSGFHEAWHSHWWLDMVIWLSWRFTGPNMIPLETPKQKDVFLRMLESLAPHRFLAGLLIYNCQISKPCYQSCITVRGCWEPYKCTCYIYIYLYIHIVLGYTQGSWVLPISLCSWICDCIEVDMCKYVLYIYKCIYLVSLFIMILDYPIIIINCTSSLSDPLLQIDIYDYCGCQHLCIVSHVSSKFLLTQMFVPADWQTAKNHITRSYLFMYVNIYKCGNMVVSKNTWMVHEGFNPQIALFLLLLDVCFKVIFLIVFYDLCIKNSPNITGVMLPCFFTKETWWMGVGIGEHYASGLTWFCWGWRLGMVTVPVSTQKSKVT